MNTLNKFRKYGFIAVVCATAVLTACDKDDDDDVTPVTNPPVENEEEVITDVKLVFTNTSDSTDIVEARAQDPDGEGVQELMILDTIRLDISKTYELTYEIFNNLETPGEDIGDEIKEEDDEHQIFYGFTSGLFSNPSGNGNIGAGATGNVNYLDEDSDAQDGSGNPVGLITRWTTSVLPRTGTFTTRLQHQPDVKSATSDYDDGDTDFELTFRLEIN